MPDLYFNGKFLSAPPTGVHRVAEEIIRAVDARLAEGDEPARAAILHPPGNRNGTQPSQTVNTAISIYRAPYFCTE